MTPNDDNPPGDIRVYFAAQRTMLAWVRTGVTLMGFGFIVARFGLFMREVAAVRELPPTTVGFSMWIGTALLILGIAINVVAALRLRAFAADFRRGTPAQPTGLGFEITLTAILTVLGLALAAYLISAA